MAYISLCVHCGEKMAGEHKYCKHCKTAEQRKKQDQENEEIKQENLTKGYVYNS